MMRKIIENTASARKEFMREASAVQAGGGGSNTFTLSREELDALQQGGCVAFDDGEFSTFILVDQAREESVP